jgi:Na+/phosphate symporter
MPTDPKDVRITELEDEVAELREVIKTQAVKLKEANVAKREHEVYAAAVILAAGGKVEVTADHLADINPAAKVKVVHHKTGGRGLTASVTSYRKKPDASR